jgi:cytosine permease
MIDSRAIASGPSGWSISRSPLFLATALFWAVATALVSLKFIRWIAYLMQFFPIFPAVMLGGAMVATLSGVSTFRPTSPTISNSNVNATTFLLTLQWIFAFSSMACVVGADWGLGSLSLRDVRLGGWIGTALAPAVIAILSLIVVAGFEGSRSGPTTAEGNAVFRASLGEISPAGLTLSSGPNGLTAPSHTFQAVMIGAFRDHRVSALLLLTFGLGSLAPAVYASFAFGNLFKNFGPGLSRLTWTMLGTCLAWFLIVGGWTSQPETFFHILGALFAPVAGAFTADYRGNRGLWPGARSGINPAGLLAWGVGLAVGLSPIIAAATGSDRFSRIQPASVLAFLAAYLTYEILAAIGLESRKLGDQPSVAPRES